VERQEGLGWTVVNLLAGLIVSKPGFEVKRALKGSARVFRKGHSSMPYKRRLTGPIVHAVDKPGGHRAGLFHVFIS
jgi:hypothetical protein